jgi:alkylated DNA nucleotide flippase Atl1
MPSLRDAVHTVVLAIPPGQVLTYGEVAAEAGSPGAARAVGAVMASGEIPLPWWRVVAADGRLVPHNQDEHARLLRSEGVPLRNGKVAMGSARSAARSDPPAAPPPPRR